MSEERIRALREHGISLRGYDFQRNLMFALPIAMRAKIVVETGLAAGESTRIFLKAMEFCSGKLYTYDYRDYPETRRAIEAEGYDVSRWCFRLMDSVEGARRWNDGLIDLLFLDSDHSKVHVLNELREWSRHLSQRAVILIHDTNHPEPHPQSCQGLEAAYEWIRYSGWRLVNLNDPLGMAFLWRE